MRHAVQLPGITRLLYAIPNIGWDYFSRIALWAHVTGGNFHLFYPRALTVPFTQPSGRHLPTVRTVQGDCERTVYERHQEGIRSTRPAKIWPSLSYDIIPAKISINK